MSILDTLGISEEQYEKAKDSTVTEAFEVAPSGVYDGKVEDVLIDSGKFELPKKLPSRVDEDINWSVVIVEATETPLERPKKTKETTTAVRKNNTP